MAAVPPNGGLSIPWRTNPADYNRHAMAATPLPDLILYTRPGCGLCDGARDIVLDLLAQRALAGQRVPEYVERDIETDPAWQREYSSAIPVVELGPRRLDLATSAAKLRRLLAEVLDTAPAPAP
jgi:glutaredoxin-like protein DUF836